MLASFQDLRNFISSCLLAQLQQWQEGSLELQMRWYLLVA